jgi:hypothetical protein
MDGCGWLVVGWLVGAVGSLTGWLTVVGRGWDSWDWDYAKLEKGRCQSAFFETTVRISANNLQPPSPPGQQPRIASGVHPSNQSMHQPHATRNKYKKLAPRTGTSVTAKQRQ